MESLIEEEEVLDGIMKGGVGFFDMEAFEEEQKVEDSSFIAEEHSEYYYDFCLEKGVMDFG